MLFRSLLENVQSAPTRALLKQWAKPIIIAPDNVVLTMKNEILLKQFVEGNKKQMLNAAVDKMFSQTDSKVVVRLPQAGDDKLIQEAVNLPKPETAVKPKVSQPKEEEPEPQEVAELQDEVKEEIVAQETKKIDKALSSLHSDNVNMIMDLFDGKVID